MFGYYDMLLNEFRSLIRMRAYSLSKEDQKKVKNNPNLTPLEITHIRDNILQNTGYYISDKEITLTFKSFQHKRTHKKKKIKYEQLRWV